MAIPINTSSKYNYGDIVSVVFSKYKPNEVSQATIVGVRAYQSQFFRKDAFIIEYAIEPLEYAGFEDDYTEWIAEVNIK